MPKRIRYTKAIGTLRPGDEEVRSDVDANIFVALGVAEEVAMMTSEPSAAALPASAAEEPALRRKRRRGKGKSERGYKRRDMTAERRT